MGSDTSPWPNDGRSPCLDAIIRSIPARGSANQGSCVISVVIPAYNAGKFIGEAIRSVLRQTCAEYEIIVIDDGSTDNTADIIGKCFPQVRYFHTPNQGVSRARNYGIRKARGEFIAFLDADDLWLPEKLEKQLAAFTADREVMLVFTEHRAFDENGFRISPFSKKERLMKGDIVKNIFLHTRVTTSTVMVRKEAIQEVGLFEENLKAAEDDNLWMRIALRCKIHLIDEVLVHYRWTENSLSRTSDSIFDGALKNVELIENKYPELRRRLGRSNIRKKKSDIYSSRGYFFFSGSHQKKARQYYLMSIAFYPNLKSLVYCLFTIIPQSIIEKTRNMKKKYKILQSKTCVVTPEKPV